MAINEVIMDNETEQIESADDYEKIAADIEARENVELDPTVVPEGWFRLEDIL